MNRTGETESPAIIKEMANEKEKMVVKQGKAVLVGRPNTGKSTLLNNILDQKVAITSPKPQTTRKNSRFSYVDERGEIIFVDTPGMMGQAKGEVARLANRLPARGISGAAVIVWLVDISRPKSEEDNRVIGLVRKSKAKKILVYNKIDRMKSKEGYRADYSFLEKEADGVLFVSALKKTHLKSLLTLIFDFLPKAKAKILPQRGDFLKSINQKEWLAELIREKAFLSLRQELPHTVGVKIELIENKKSLIKIEATVYTTEDRYKAMIVGRGGKMIKDIGSQARKEMELALNKKVFLQLRVVTNRHWPRLLLE